jgi:hypothetical protein
MVDRRLTALGGRLGVRYAVLTVCLAAPLLVAFAAIRNTYPFAAATMMMGGAALRSPHTYHVLLGETVGDEIVQVRAVALTNALTGRHWGLVASAVYNRSFTVRWPHPANRRLLEQAGGADKLPDAVRVPELLQAWGRLYNARVESGSPRRLRAIVLEEHRWDPDGATDQHTFVRSWRQPL